MSFTVATADASDMDFGRKGELIGKRVNSSAAITHHLASYPLTGLQTRRLHSRSGIKNILYNYHKIHVAFGQTPVSFASNRQEIPHYLHVPIPLLPMGQVGRLGEPDPLHVRELIEEGLETCIVDLVVFSVGQKCPICDFGDAVED
jgi:hypothetical protein